MSELSQALATILADAPQRLILSKQVSKTQEYRKVVIEKKSDCYQIAKYTENRCFTRTVTQTAWQTICPRQWAVNFCS